jgi:hypothetical protein
VAAGDVVRVPSHPHHRRPACHLVPLYTQSPEMKRKKKKKRKEKESTNNVNVVMRKRKGDSRKVTRLKLHEICGTF